MSHITLEDFQRFVGAKIFQATIRRLKIENGGTYSEFVEQLYDDIDESIFSLQASRELRQEDNEDRITQDILFCLRRYGYSATHDSKTGGHVDISVRLGEHSWIAEAKKDGGFWEGLLQLTTRYVQASGNFGHDHAGLLFYMVNTADARGTLNEWRRKVADDGNACFDCAKNALAFYSKHKLTGPGTDFFIRTMVVSLHHRPLDKSARRAANKREGKAGSGSGKP